MSIANQPAFPVEPHGGFGPADGLTKREWLIGMALQGQMAADSNADLSARQIAIQAIDAADAVIARLDSEAAG